MSGKKRILSSGAPAGLLWSRSGNEVWFGTNDGIVAVTLSGRTRLVFHSLSLAMPLDMSREGRDVLALRISPRAHISSTSATAAQQGDFSWFDSSATADISADGKTLLLYEWGGSGVYLRKTDGSDAVRLGDGRALALSLDGKWALAVQETSQLKLIMLPTGPGEQEILPLGNISEIYWGAWFPDGRQIMFVGAEPGHLLRTYVHNLDSGNTSPVTAEGMVGVLVSPDNKQIAAYGPDGNYYLVWTAGGEPKAVPGALPGDTAIRWSNDGRSIYFRAASDFEVKIYRVDLNSDRREFWRKLAPADPVGMIGIGSDPRGVLITPDGNSVVYTYWSANGELYLLGGLQ
jgi:WD40 repeat protein